MTYYENDYREIITKAVCGTGQKLINETNQVVSQQRPTSILGCWVINHWYHAKKSSSEMVEVQGSYDINIWYSFNDNTKTEVITEKVEYCDEVVLSNQDIHCLNDGDEVIVKVVQQPNCLQCKIDDEGNNIAVEVEKEFIVKVIGETKVNVLVDPNRHKNVQMNQEQKGEEDMFKGNRRWLLLNIMGYLFNLIR